MKKEVHVHIYINDEAPPRSSYSSASNIADQHYIEVYRDDAAPEHKLDDILAHELGHVIQRIFNTEASQGDPRMRVPDHIFRAMVAVMGIPPVFRDSMVRAEKEAWMYAAKMIPIDPKLEAKDVKTYEDQETNPASPMQLMADVAGRARQSHKS